MRRKFYVAVMAVVMSGVGALAAATSSTATAAEGISGYETDVAPELSVTTDSSDAPGREAIALFTEVIRAVHDQVG